MQLRTPAQTTTPSTGRFLAPDLARGLMLAMIALANVMIYLHGRPYGLRQHVLTDSLADHVLTGVLAVVVDGRAYPLFAALFGYGLVQMARSRRARGMAEDAVRRAIRRRSVVLIAFGAVHAVLAFSGDILGWYGLLGLLIAGLLRLSNRKLLWLAGLWLVLASAVQAFALTGPTQGTERSYFWSYELSEPLTAAGLRVIEWLMSPFGMLAVASALLIGVWAGRHRILEHPHLHRVLLRRTAAIGIIAGIAGGIGPALIGVQVWSPQPSVVFLLSWLHVITGVLCGLGYAALIALIAARLTASGRDRGPVVQALQATGQRSLSCYLAQSVVFAALLPAGTLGLGSWLGPAAAAGLALLTWAGTVLAAAAWAPRTGPAEALLRRMMDPSRVRSRATINA